MAETMPKALMVATRAKAIFIMPGDGVIIRVDGVMKVEDED